MKAVDATTTLKNAAGAPQKPTFTQLLQFGNWSLDVLTAVGIGILAGLLMMGTGSTPHGVAAVVTPLLFLMYFLGVARNLSPIESFWRKIIPWVSFTFMIIVLILIAAIGWGFYDGSDVGKCYLLGH